MYPVLGELVIFLNLEVQSIGHGVQNFYPPPLPLLLLGLKSVQTQASLPSERRCELQAMCGYEFTALFLALSACPDFFTHWTVNCWENCSDQVKRMTLRGQSIALTSQHVLKQQQLLSLCSNIQGSPERNYFCILDVDGTSGNQKTDPVFTPNWLYELCIRYRKEYSTSTNAEI